MGQNSRDPGGHHAEDPPHYPSDLSDQEWAILEPLLSSAERRGRPPKWPQRHVADAVFYLLASATSWLTRAGWCWPRGFMAPTYPIGTAGDDC